jgi:hypothetical protein
MLIYKKKEYTMEKKNYLSNKEILREIHKSKMSFCYLMDKRYFYYDVIIDTIEDITEAIIEQAKKNRAKRLSIENWEKDVLLWENNNKKGLKPKLSDYEIDYNNFDINDLVIRVMTFEHIPLDDRKPNPKTIADKHARCNFPPFKHYSYIENTWKEVARSHWKGDLTTGQFSLINGKMTNKLGLMMLKLVEKYSTKSNWRNYSYVDEMRGNAILQLTQFGLYFDESKGNNPFAYFTSTLNNSFTGYLNSEKKNQSIRDDLLQDAGYMPSYTRQMNDELAQQLAREEFLQKDLSTNI